MTTVFTMAGVGAAFVLIPVFLAFGIELQTAMATALLLNAVAMAVASSTFIRKGWWSGGWLCPCWCWRCWPRRSGSKLAQGLDRRCIMGCSSPCCCSPPDDPVLPAPGASRPGPTREALTLGLPVGALAGFVGGLLGVGGGNIIVPALVAAGLEPKRASASASFVVLFASLAGFLAHVSVARIDLAC